MLDPFGIHSRVLCRGMMGVVKFIGKTHLGPITFIGIEVGEKNGGEHNGEVNAAVNGLIHSQRMQHDQMIDLRTRCQSKTYM